MTRDEIMAGLLQIVTVLAKDRDRPHLVDIAAIAYCRISADGFEDPRLSDQQQEMTREIIAAMGHVTDLQVRVNRLEQQIQGLSTGISSNADAVINISKHSGDTREMATAALHRVEAVEKKQGGHEIELAGVNRELLQIHEKIK